MPSSWVMSCIGCPTSCSEGAGDRAHQRGQQACQYQPADAGRQQLEDQHHQRTVGIGFDQVPSQMGKGDFGLVNVCATTL